MITEMQEETTGYFYNFLEKNIDVSSNIFSEL